MYIICFEFPIYRHCYKFFKVDLQTGYLSVRSVNSNYLCELLRIYLQPKFMMSVTDESYFNIKHFSYQFIGARHQRLNGRNCAQFLEHFESSNSATELKTIENTMYKCYTTLCTSDVIRSWNLESSMTIKERCVAWDA